MPLRQALTAPWRGIQSHPYFYQFLLANVFSRLFFFAVAHDLGILDLRRLIYDPQYVRPRIEYILVPELTGTTGVMYMVSVYILTFLVVEISWKMDRFAARTRTSSRLYNWLVKAVGVTWRHMIPAVLVLEAGGAVARIRGFLVLDLVWMSVSVIFLGRFTWPVLRASMIIRDRRITVARLAADLSRLVEAFPVVTRCQILTDDDCPICLLSLGRASCAAVRTPGCGHVFCRVCIFDWLAQSEGRCPVCRHDIYRELKALLSRSYGFLAFPRLILQTTVDIWGAFKMHMWNSVTTALSALVWGCSSIVSLFRTAICFVTSLRRFVTPELIWFINELAGANEPALDNGRASETNSKDDFDTVKKYVEELVMTMRTQSGQISQISEEQLRQAQDIRTLAAALERMQGARSVVAVAPESVGTTRGATETIQGC